MNTPLQKAAQAAIANSDEFYALYKRTVTSGCIPVCELKFVAAQKELRKALDAELAQSGEPVAWAMCRSDGLVLDVICPDEHESYEGEYTIPLYLHPPQPQATTPAVPKRLSDSAKSALVNAWFAEGWAQKAAYGMLDDFEASQGEKL